MWFHRPIPARKNSRHALISTKRPVGRRGLAKQLLRVEPLEDRRLLSVDGLAQSWVEEVSPGVFLEQSLVTTPLEGLASVTSEATEPVVGDSTLNSNGLQFNFNPAPGTPQNVIDGFVEAGNLWSEILTDDILINVDISFPALGPGILGSTTRVTTSTTYTAFHGAITDDLRSADDATAVSSLQATPDFDLRLNYTSDNPNGAGSATPYVDNDGGANNTTIQMARANAKALGLVAAGDVALDSSIAFSSLFAWDFDRSDGITAGSYDFVGVAAHEIGHALGFISGVDVLDTNSGTGGDPGPFNDDQFTYVSPLDMYRYSAASGSDLEWSAGQAAGSQFFSIDGGVTNLTTYSTGRTLGDGQQASHWQDNLGIGIMDPTLASGEFSDITAMDVLAFDVIGWDLSGTVGAMMADPVFDGTAGDDEFVISRNATDTNIVQVELNGTVIFAQQMSATHSISINGLGGNDTLLVDSVNGLLTLDYGIRFDGGTGWDAASTHQIGGSTRAVETYTVGPNPGEGIDVIMDSFDAPQYLYFENLEPFLSYVPVTLFTVNGTPADNAINYTLSPTLGGTWGRVTVDNFEAIHFSNKTNLVINGQAGSDEINLNNLVTPTGLGGIIVNGGDPAGSDTLIVTAIPGTLDYLDFIPSGQGSGTVQKTGVAPVFSGIEHLILALQQAEGDEGAVSGTAGDDEFEYTQGATRDTYTMTGTMDLNNSSGHGPYALVPTTVVGTNPDADTDINFLGAGGSDTLIFNATAGDDAIESLATTGTLDGVMAIRNTVNGNVLSFLDLSDITSVVIRGHAGDDTFTHDGAVAIPVAYEGGDPSDSDVLELLGAAQVVENVEIAPDAANPTEQDVAGLGAAIDVSGVELITYTGADSDDVLTVAPGDGDEASRIESQDRTSGVDRVTADTLPEIHFSGLDTFVLDQVFGIDTATFALGQLNGATSYEVESSAGDSVIVEAFDGGFFDSLTVTNPAAGYFAVTALYDFNRTLTETLSGAARLELRTLGGDDRVTVDNSSGLISNPITYDGGVGSDTLLVLGTTPVQQVEYLPGPDVLEGRLLYDLDWTTPDTHEMTIDFINLEPIVDLVPKTVALTVYGTNADNAINYSAGLHSGQESWLNPTAMLTGLVSVDAYETIEFGNFTGADDVLEILGLAGDDAIHLNNPTTPAGLERIWVEGNDPTGSDTLIVNGVAPTVGIDLDAQRITGASGAAGAIPVDFWSVEAIHVTAGAATALSVSNALLANPIDYVYTPGAAVDAGSIQNALVPIAFTGFGAGTTLNFVGDSSDGNDTLVVNGSAGDDTFSVAGATGNVTLATSGLTRAQITSSNIEYLTLEGLDGADAFTVAGNHPYYTLNANGGSPGDSDVLTFNGSGLAMMLNLESQWIAEYGIAYYSAIETIYLNAGVGHLTVWGTSVDDDLTVTLLNDVAGRIEQGAAVQKVGEVGSETVAPVVDYTLFGGGSLSVNLAGGEDTLIVVGNAVDQTFTVDAALGTVAVDDLGDATNDGSLAFLDVQSLFVFGLEGDDTFDVTPGAIPVFIDGGDPIGTTAGDQIHLLGAGGVAFESGPETDEGSFLVGSLARVSFDHIESALIDGAVCALIEGTNADDDITVIARDASTHAGADGVQDFTTSVNAGLELLWLNATNLYIDGLAGDDDIVLRTPAPNGVSWNTDVYVAGGAPSAGPDLSEGDRLVLETPGADSIVYTPTGSDTGTLLIDENGNLADDGVDSLITIGPFTVACPDLAYTSDPGGIELLVYDGEGGADGLRVVGTAGADRVEHAPGGGFDEGTIRVNTLLGVTYQNLGAGAALTVDGSGGADTLVVLGTAASDAWGVAGGTGTVTLNARLAVQQVSAELLVLEGLDGDDSFTVSGAHPYTSVTVSGGDPGASDELNFLGTGGAVAADLAVPSLIEAGFGAVILDGMEVVHITAAGGDLTATGTADDDEITYTPTGADEGNFQNAGDTVKYYFTEVDAFTVAGAGDDADSVVVRGTNNHDVISVDAPARTVMVENVSGVVLQPVVLDGSVEQVTVLGRLGNDTIVVVPGVGVGDLPLGNLLIHVDGGPPGASDALVIASDVNGGALADTDFVVIHKSRVANEGVVRVFRDATGVVGDEAPAAATAPIQLPDISYADVEVVSPQFGPLPAAAEPNLLVLGPDMYEENEYINVAAYIGSGATQNVTDLAIFPNTEEHRFVPADIDWYRFVPQINGTLDIQVYFQDYNPELLPAGGDIDIEVYDADGTLIAGSVNPLFGSNESAVDADERVRIPVVAGQTYYLRVLGGLDATINGYSMTVENTAAPVAYDLELDDFPVNGTTNPPGQSDNSDTGRSQTDNITYDNTPTIRFRLDDALFLHDLPGNATDDTPPDQVTRIPFNPSQLAVPDDVPGTTSPAGYRLAVYGEGDPQQPGALPQVLVGYARQIVEGVYEFDFATDALGGVPFVLTDGSQFLSVKVEIIDPADPTQLAYGARSTSLEIVVDTVAPPVSLGFDTVTDDGLHPDSDTGIEDQPALFTDNITSDTTPTFWGYAEADAVIRVYADTNANGGLDLGVDVLLGLTVAAPEDGTNQFPAGYWELTSAIDMNDPAYFPDIDGVRTIFVTAEDVAGNVTPAEEAEALNIFIDTRGPQVDDVVIYDDPTYDLFDPKPSTDGPTPVTTALDIQFIDEPVRVGESVVVGDDAVFVIDISGSTISGFLGTPVGDLNADGNSDTILDAEIAGFIALNQQLIAMGLGNVSNVSIVAFSSWAVNLDMDPVAPDTQIATTPLADTDANGISDVEDALRSLSSSGGTNFEVALQQAITTITAVGTAPGNGNVIFLSDGYGSGSFADEVATLNGMGMNVRAFGVGAGSDLSQLQTIDPAAIQFTTTDELLDVFGGGGGAVGGTFVYSAVNEILATTAGNIVLVGDANGVIPIREIELIDYTVAGDIGRTTVRLHFYAPLPDDRYTLTVYDSIQDDAGNALDGEANTIEPQETPYFPSGDGNPGGDFTARFTIDTRPELGVWAAGSVSVDTNGNFVFDPANTDYTNRDIVYRLGFTSDDIFAGNFAGLGGPNGGVAEADGFDKLAAYGLVDDSYRWLIDVNNDGVVDPATGDVVATQGSDSEDFNGLPFAGNFDGNALNGDEVALFNANGVWWFDTNHDFVVDTSIAGSFLGYPFAADFDGDGYEDIGTWTNDVFTIDLSSVGPTLVATLPGIDGTADVTFTLQQEGFIGTRERPVAADMDADGFADLGLWVPDRAVQGASENGEWYWLLSGNNVIELAGLDPADWAVNAWTTIMERIVIDPVRGNPVVNFTPVPFGDDLYAAFGDEFAIPVVGNFDPPITNPTALTVVAAAAAEVFEITGGDTLVLKINGVEQSVASGIRAIDLTGLGADDSVIVIGTDGDETIDLGPDGGSVQGADYRVSFTFAIAGDVSVVVQAGGGADRATLTGTAADEAFRGALADSRLAGGTLLLRVLDVEEVTAVGNGGADVARLYDTAGDETLLGAPNSATLTGAAYAVTAEGFGTIHAFASGGTDTAVLRDSDGDDTFWALPTEAKLYAGTDYFLRAKGFDAVRVQGSGNGYDQALLYGSRANETMAGSPTEATMAGAGYSNAVSQFDYVASAGKGGYDQATFTDSEGDDAFLSNRLYGRLAGDGWLVRAFLFDAITAIASSGDDVARFYDSEWDDTYTGSPTESRMVGRTFDNTAVGFATVHVFGGTGGHDVAWLYDSTQNDTFIAGATESMLYGPTFSQRVRAFQEVYAEATAGGYDKAEFTGTDGDDQWEAAGDWIRLSNSDLILFAQSFAEVKANQPTGTDIRKLDAIDFILTLEDPTDL